MATDETPDRQRSRAYPALNLAEAVLKAEILRQRAGYRFVPVEVVVEYWDYSVTSSRGLRAASALMKYGLLEDEGAKRDRKVRLTSLAKRLLEHPDPVERQKALEQAALTPALFREIWERHQGSLPDDSMLRWDLKADPTLNDNSVEALVIIIRSSFEHAGLDGERAMSDKGLTPEAAEGEERPQKDKPPPPPGTPPMPEPNYKDARPYDLPILLPTGEQVILRMPDRQAPETYDFLVRALQLHLELMRPALTRGFEEMREPEASQTTLGL